MKIDLSDKRLQYSGRIDRTDPKRPIFIFPASSLSFSFVGTGASVVIKNQRAYWGNYIGIIVDGVQRKEQLADTGCTTILLAENLEEKEHTIILFKRQDSCHIMTLEELLLTGAGRLTENLERPVRRIEVYGDSVSAGEVSEATEYAGKTDPEHNGEYSNSWYSFGWIAARRLKAEIHDIAQGGIALQNGTGWFLAPSLIGIESVWDKVHYNPEFGAVTEWDFQQYIPQVVIVAIGQNDNNPEDYMKTDMEGGKAQRWRDAYQAWIRSIRKKYPKAFIILSTTILEHHENWDASIERVCRELKDSRIVHFLYSKNGVGTPGHIRIMEAEQMADELCAFIEGLSENIWGE
jgi:hypothetical protein